jgi:hypothetical protein
VHTEFNKPIQQYANISNCWHITASLSSSKDVSFTPVHSVSVQHESDISVTSSV